MYDAKDVKKFCLFLEAAFVSEMNGMPFLLENNVRSLFQHRFPLFEIPEKLNNQGVRSLTLDLFMGIINEEIILHRQFGNKEFASDLEFQALGLYSGLSCTMLEPVVDTVDSYDFKSVLHKMSCLSLLKNNTGLKDALSKVLSDSIDFISHSTPDYRGEMEFSELLVVSSILESSSNQSVVSVREYLDDCKVVVGNTLFSCLDIITSYSNAVLADQNFDLDKNHCIDITYTHTIENLAGKVNTLKEQCIDFLSEKIRKGMCIFYTTNNGDKVSMSSVDLNNVVETLYQLDVENIASQKFNNESLSEVAFTI